MAVVAPTTTLGLFSINLHAPFRDDNICRGFTYSSNISFSRTFYVGSDRIRASSNWIDDKHVAFTLHGPGYGPDESEAFRSQLAGCARTFWRIEELLTQVLRNRQWRRFVTRAQGKNLGGEDKLANGHPMRVTVHSRKRVLDGFFKVDEVKLQYEKFDGSMTPVLTRLNFERGDSVAAVVLNTDTRKIILVNQFKYPSHEKGPGWITEVVAGMVGPGESPESAIQREILEESGYRTTRLEHISTFYVSPGGSSERIVLFYAEVTDSSRCATGGGLDSEDEDIRLIEIPLSEVSDTLASQTIKDAKSIIALMWLQARETVSK